MDDPRRCILQTNLIRLKNLPFFAIYIQYYMQYLDFCIIFQSQHPYEPQHEKTNKMSVPPAKTQISLGIRPVWSVFAVCMEKPGVLSLLLNTQRRLWSECSLGAQSFCWFPHAAAHYDVLSLTQIFLTIYNDCLGKQQLALFSLIRNYLLNPWKLNAIFSN